MKERIYGTPMLHLHLSPLWQKKLYTWGEWITWGLPPLMIPSMRLFQDPAMQPNTPKTNSRRRLFIRDFCTYTLGTAAYFIGKAATLRLLKRQIDHRGIKELIALTVGVMANVGFAGYAAPRISAWVDDKLEDCYQNAGRSPRLNLVSAQPGYSPPRPSVSLRPGSPFASFSPPSMTGAPRL